MRILFIILFFPLVAFSTIVLVENFFNPNPFPPKGWSIHYEGDAQTNMWYWRDTGQIGNGYATGEMHCTIPDEYGIADLNSAMFNLTQNGECDIRFLNRSDLSPYLWMVSADVILMEGEVTIASWPIPNLGEVSTWQLVDLSFSPIPTTSPNYYVTFRITGQSQPTYGCWISIDIDDVVVEDIPTTLKVEQESVGRIKSSFY